MTHSTQATLESAKIPKNRLHRFSKVGRMVGSVVGNMISEGSK